MKNIFWKYSIVICSIAFLQLGCGNDQGINAGTNGGDLANKEFRDVPKLSSARPNLNVSILLDLSDRIDTNKYPNATMQFYRRDIAYAKSIARAFTNHCLNKKVVTMDDRIQVFVEPAPSSIDVNSWLADLKLHISKDNVSKQLLGGIESVYEKNLDNIYRTTISRSDYPGSDIWGFFDKKVEDYCIKEGSRNVLFILTDGYMYYEHNIRSDGNGKSNKLIPQDLSKMNLLGNDWKAVIQEKNYGFIVPADLDLEGLEVFVIGINGYNKSAYAEDVIKYFWDEWLKELNVSKHKLKSTELPNSIDGLIEQTIYSE